MGSKLLIPADWTEHNQPEEFLMQCLAALEERPIGFLGIEGASLFRVFNTEHDNRTVFIQPRRLMKVQPVQLNISALFFTQLSEKKLEKMLYQLMEPHQRLEKIGYKPSSNPINPLEKALSSSTVSDSIPEKLIKDELFIRDKGWLKRLQISDINWIKVEGVYTHLHCSENEYTLRSTSREVLDKLPRDQFIQVHKSFYVNVCKIEAVNSSSVKIKNELLPIGRTYYRKVIDHLNKVD